MKTLKNIILQWLNIITNKFVIVGERDDRKI